MVLEQTKTMQNEFIGKITEVYNKCSGHESYGNVTEFYDEDGIVLMTATEEQDGKILFSFSEDNDDSFEYEEN